MNRIEQGWEPANTSRDGTSKRSLTTTPDTNVQMIRGSRWLVSLVAVLAPVACSSTHDGEIALQPGPPSTAGAAGAAGATSVPAMSQVTCTRSSDCPAKGSLCQAGLCACELDKPDVCGTGASAQCVSKHDDADNCGECGKACAPGAACSNGVCGAPPNDLANAAGCGGEARLALQAGNLYWTEKTSGKVRSVPVTGGAIVDIASGQLAPTQIAADANGVYWVNQGDGSPASSQVMKLALPLTGAPAQALKTATGSDTFPALTIGGGKLYYALHTDVHQISTDEQATGDVIVGRSVNFSSTSAPVVYGEVMNLAVSDSEIIWGTPGTRNMVETHTLTPWDDVNDMTGYARLGKTVTTTSDVGIDAKYGYWRDGERFLRDAVDAKMALAEVVTLAPYSKLITAFALTSNAVYASVEDGVIFTHSLIPADPSDDTTIVPPVLVARDQASVTSMVSDGATLYWVTSDCQLRSLPL